MKLFTILVLILVIYPILSPAQSNKKGDRIIRNYAHQHTVSSSQQYFMTTQDHRGVMYLANIENLAEFDGTEWRAIRGFHFPSCIACDPETGIVYASSSEDFGYLAADEKGMTVFRSLIPTLSKDAIFDADYKIEFYGDKVFFIGRRSVIEYNKTTKVSEVWNNSTFANTLFEGTIYGTKEGGNYVYIETKDTTIQTNIELNDYEILMNAHRLNNHEILATLSEDIKVLNTNTNTSRVISLGDFSEKIGYSGQLDKITPINDNLLAISTRGATPVAAFALVDTLLNVKEYIGSKTGLRENFSAFSFYNPADGLLWSNDWGVSTINMRTPLRIMGRSADYQGVISALYSDGERLYCGTSNGLYERSIDKDGYYSFHRVETSDYTGTVYTLNGYTNPYTGKKGVLAGTDGGLFVVEEGKSHNINRYVTFGCIQSSSSPTRLYSFMSNEVKIGTIKPNLSVTSVNKVKLPVATNISEIAEYNGRIWCATYENDMYSIDLTTLEVASYEKKEMDPRILGSIPAFTDFNNIVGIDANYEFTDTLATDMGLVSPYNTYNNGFFVSSISEKRSYLGFVIPNNNDSSRWKFHKVPDQELCDISATYFYLDKENNTLYFSADNTIYSYEIDNDFNTKANELSQYDYNALVREVRAKDTLIFAGNFMDQNGVFTLKQPKDMIPTFKYEDADLAFSYSATCYEKEENTLFSYFLEGYSENWSDWSTTKIINFTNLREGKYTFKVKANNIYNKESSIGEYSFIVSPPYYRSFWAYILYVALLAGIIYISIKLYSKKLKRENEMLERIVDERTKTIRKRDDEILSNINYASYIQHAALTPKDKISIIFPEHFIMYRPHTIVSGDFYMVTSFGTKKICIVGDCTGHGVSGGFLSMLGMAFFRQIVSVTQKPSEILQEMRTHIIENLHQNGETAKNQDGMDASVYVIDSTTNELEFAGANSRLVIIHNGELIELKGDKMPVSTHFVHGQDDEYTNNTFELSNGDMVYTFSDGYIDQFGGKDNKKFKMSRFRELLLSVHSLPLEKQSEIINKTFDEYKGDNPQTDDVVVMGVRV